MRDHMLAYLVKNNLIMSSQQGSQQGRSTTTNLLEYLERLTDMLENGESFDIRYLYFAKYSTHWPEKGFLRKLQGFG